MDGFTDGWALGLLAVAGFMAVVYLRSMRRVSNTRAELADRGLHARLGIGHTDLRRAARNVLLVFAAALAALSIARPTGSVADEERRSGGMDVIVALDLSLSMAAEEDYGPRLERAREVLHQLVARTPNNRYGLVTFSGEATVVCPLTHDHEAFITMLDTEGISLGATQGTAMGDAITAAMERFRIEKDIPRAVLVVSDGENTYGQDPVQAAAAAAEAGLKVHALGVGSGKGAKIPLGRDIFGTVSYKYDRNGRVVITKLDEETLRAVTVSGGGKYYHASGQGAAEGLRLALNERSEAAVETGMKTRIEFGPAVSLAAAGLLLVALVI